MTIERPIGHNYATADLLSDGIQLFTKKYNEVLRLLAFVHNYKAYNLMLREKISGLDTSKIDNTLLY